MKNSFEIAFGSITNDVHERVIKNALVIDVLGNVAVFVDLQPVNMTIIQNKLGGYGALLAISELQQRQATQDGHSFGFEFSSSHRKVITPEQKAVLSDLAAHDINDDKPLANKLVKRSRHILPVLWYPEVAFTTDGLSFREGQYHSHFINAINYVGQTISDLHTETHREFNAKIRGHLSAKGFDMRHVPMVELDDQTRQRQLDEINPEYSRLFANAQELQLHCTDLSSQQFAITVSKAYLTHTATI